jgi:hypothetical protein
MTKKFELHAVTTHGGMPPRHTATGIGKVDLPGNTNLPSLRTPTELDIYNAINDIGQKLGQLGKNQQVLEAKLDYLTKRLDAANANVIMAAEYLSQLGWSTQWLIAGAMEASTKALPKHLPHWQ